VPLGERRAGCHPVGHGSFGPPKGDENPRGAGNRACRPAFQPARLGTARIGCPTELPRQVFDRATRFLILAAFSVALASAQQFQFNLDHLASKASETVDISLNGSMLQFAAKFLDAKDPDQNKVKKLIGGLEGIYVKSFEFQKAGEWSPADLEAIRKQLKTPEWSKIVGRRSTTEGETDEIYLRTENGKISGVAILVAEPKELTVVNIAGPVDLDSLAELGGHFHIPKVDVGKQK
jgi:hypothetical protein